MDDAFRIEVFEALVDIADVGPDFFLRHASPFFGDLLQGAFLAQFSDEITVVYALEHLVAPDRVGMLQCPRDGDLLL